MTTVNMKDYVNGNVNENKAVQEVIGKISKAETKVSANVINTVVPILGNKERTLEQRAEDIGELKGILASSIASGLSKVILKIPVRLLAMDTAYQIPERTERSLGKLLKEWDYDSCDPLLGVPHFEDGYIAVVDGTGRVRASNVIDSDKYEKLDVTVLLKAPSDPKERQKFEAKKYEYQNSGTEPLKDYQKHGARLVTNHQFNWWFDFSPPKGYITTRPTGRCHKHFYWSAIKRYYQNLLFLILLPALLYTSVQLHQ